MKNIKECRTQYICRTKSTVAGLCSLACISDMFMDYHVFFLIFWKNIFFQTDENRVFIYLKIIWNYRFPEEWIRKLWYIYTMEYYSAIKKNTFESVLMRWMKLEPIIQSEVSQKEKHQYSILTHIYIWNLER